MAAHAPDRDSVSTTARIDKFKGARNKKKLLQQVGYRQPEAGAATAQQGAQAGPAKKKKKIGTKPSAVQAE